MTLAEFERLLDSWGSERANWPPSDRTAVEALLAQSPSARDLLARYESFARLFDPADTPPAPPTAALLAAAMAQPQQPQPPGVVVQLRRNWMAFGWPHAVGLAACLAAGLVIGALDLPGDGAPSYQTFDLIDGGGPSDD